MEKLKHSLSDNLPGNAYVRMTTVVKGHHKAIEQLAADLTESKDYMEGLIRETGRAMIDRSVELERRIEAIENTWYRKLGRWIMMSIFRKKRKA